MAKTPNQRAWDAEIKRIMRELQNTGNAPKLTKYIPKKPQKITQADLAKLRKITPGNIKRIKFGAEPETVEPKTGGNKSEPPRRIRRTSIDSEIPKGRTYTPHLRVKGTGGAGGAGGSGGGRKKQTKPPKPPLTPEEKKRIRSEAGKRRWQNMSQEAKDAAIRRMREGARKRRESMTSEEREAERQRRSKQSKEAWERKSEAEKEAIKARLREAAQKHREEQASKEKTPEEEEEEPGSPATPESTPEPALEPSPEQPSPEYVAPYAAVEDEYIRNYLDDFNRGIGVYDEFIRHLLEYVQREGGDVTTLFDILERLRFDGKLAERVQHGYLSEHTLAEMKNVIRALENEDIDIGLDEDDIEELYERDVGIAETYAQAGLSYHSAIKQFADATGRRKRRDE